MQARTKDFVNVDIRADVDGQVCGQPFAENVPERWRRLKPLFDTKGEPLRSMITGIDSDDKAYFF